MKKKKLNGFRRINAKINAFQRIHHRRMFKKKTKSCGLSDIEIVWKKTGVTRIVELSVQ